MSERTGRIPTLEGERVVLRPFRAEDADDVQRLAGAREVAEGTLTIPHPYPDDAAQSWISTHPAGWDAGTDATWAITVKDGAFIGAIGLSIARDQGSAELGYWIGVEYWNQGFATEAARLVVAFAFDELNLHRVHAHHFTRNPGSGRVMQKIGMLYEGRQRGAAKRFGRYEDIESYGILRTDWTG